MDKKEQVALAGELQELWLKHMKKLLENGTITSTDLATLQRFLSQNGWTLDPQRLPQGLRDKLTEHLSPEDFDDGDVIPLRRQG